ncbi:MAG: GNAT family N-acetyltransferase [Haloferacaceae archaeon]
MFPGRIETERLRLVPRTPEYLDYLEVYEHCSADGGIEEVTQFLPWEPHDHPMETRKFLERGARLREEGEVADYAIRPREGEPGAGEFAGFCGLEVEWDLRRGELGIWLRQRFWGRGYSGERAAALLELAFDRLDLEVVRVTHHPDNEKSRRAIRRYVDRFGGRKEGRLRNAIAHADGTVRDQIAYSIDRSEWREAVDGMDAPPTVRYEWNR